MTQFTPSDREVNRVIRSWLNEDRQEDVSRIAGVVLDQLDATPQRRIPWWPARRTPTMNKFVAIGLGAAAVVAVLLIGSNLLGSDSQPPGDAPSASIEPSALPSEAEPSVAGGLPEGPHVIFSEPPSLTVMISAPDWYAGGGVLNKGHGGRPDKAGMIVFTGQQFYVLGDACHWRATPPTSVTTVDEFVAALSSQGSRTVSEPVDITLDGYTGKSITLEVPSDLDFPACDPGASGSWTCHAATDEPCQYHQGPDYVDTVYILDLDSRIMAWQTGYFTGTPAETVAELEAIVQSAVIGD
jgi:hypothetical protein